MKAYLTAKIATLSAQLQQMDRDRQLITGQLRAYEDSLQHFLDQASVVGGVDDPVPPSTAPAKTKVPSSAFEMSKDWLRVMRELCKSTRKGFKAIDMVVIGRNNGFATKTENARSQLAFYEKKKYVRRLDRGLYTITAEGKAVFQNAEAPAASTASAPQVTGEVSASPSTG